MPLAYTVVQMDTPTPAFIDATDLSGEDISLHGDLIETPGGDWATVTKVQAAQQSVEREAAASPGHFPRRPDWGMGLVDNLLHASSRDVRDRQTARVRSRLAANPRIDRVRLVDVTARTDTPGIGATVVTIRADVAGQPVTLSASISPRGSASPLGHSVLKAAIT